MACWSRELKQVVRFLVCNSEPCILYWGDKFTIIYNEACISLIGAKHPSMQGKDAHDVFPHFWGCFDQVKLRRRALLPRDYG
jgi:hypothetical protein